MFGVLHAGSYAVQPIHIGLILETGIVLLAMVLFRFARILGGLLDLIHKPPLEVWLVLAGWVMILGFAMPHYLAVAVFYPNLMDPWMARGLWICRTVSFVGLLVASVLAVVPSYLYYRWSTR
ncbi:MAG: hypothetical protein NVS4B8_29850 [Herpetosiphon sp.]